MGAWAQGDSFWEKVDDKIRPLGFYANLELWIAVSAALTPILLWLVRAAYIALGGSATLGSVLATILRLVLAGAVLGVPTFLMGGTLPAAARAVETDADTGRGKLALLYGANALGAVVGVLLSTFWLLEWIGNRGTLWLASRSQCIRSGGGDDDFAVTAIWYSASSQFARTRCHEDPRCSTSARPRRGRCNRFCFSAYGTGLVSDDDAAFGRDYVYVRADSGDGTSRDWTWRWCVLLALSGASPHFERVCTNVVRSKRSS